ncbi:hypothetical protein [Pseudescherichia sp.]|uniref:hypothetical protein n=1 Tax=Pseudescherichia sp. TaxID=2055881 RepID=UPI003916D7AF
MKIVRYEFKKVVAYTIYKASGGIHGIAAPTLQHMEHDVTATPNQRQVWIEEMNKCDSDLKARGYCHDALSFLPHGGARSHQLLYV